MTDRYTRTILGVKRIYCPRNCGWFRDFTDNTLYLDRIVGHPIYGPVTGKELAQLDIQEHDCYETHNSRIRLRRIRNARNSSSSAS